MIADHIKKDIDQLAEIYSIRKIIDDNPIIVIIENFPLPIGFKISHTELLLQIPIAYPNSGLNMFWVDEEAVPKDKILPFKIHHDIMDNKNWFRYSWHPTNWTPGSDNLLSFIEFINRGLIQVLK